MRTPKFLLILLLTISFSLVKAQTCNEEQKITHLILYVKNLDAVFIRNGTEHPPTQAAEHLKMKREKAGNRIKTAEDFIMKVGSKSSLSGDPYMIRFKNGKEFSSEMVFRLELKKLAEGKVKLLTE